MSAMFVKFVLILCVSNCLGLLDGKNPVSGNRPRTFQDLEAFVHQKFEDMKRLLAEKDTCVDRLEFIMKNQEVEITQLKLGIKTLEQELLHKNGVVDILHNRVTDLEMAVMFQTIPKETESPQHGNSQTLANDVLDNFKHPVNETAFLQQSVGSTFPTNERLESSLRNNSSLYSQSGSEQLTDSTVSVNITEPTVKRTGNASRPPIPRYVQKRVAPPSQTPKQRIAFHVILSRDKYYHDDNTVVFELEKLDHGDGYNPTDGIYTAPETGTYVFTWKLICEKHHYFETILVVNGVTMGTSFTDASHVDMFDQSSSVVVTTVNQGEHVFIRMGNPFGDGILLSRNNVGKSTFSGWKLD